ncbi:MAG: LptF/LptG family permease [Acidobacteriota bacterium]
MLRLDRYVLREILPPTLLSLSLYIFLLLTNILFEVAREALQNQLGLLVVLKLLYYQLPALLVVSLPMSILLGTLIGIGRLSADSEVIALQAAGIPFRALTRPVAGLGIVATLVGFYFVAYVAPEGAYLHHLMKRDVYLSRYINTDRFGPRVFHTSIPGVLLYYDQRDETTGGLQRVILYEKDDGPENVERLTVARRGEISFDDSTGRMHLLLEDGTTHARSLDSGPLDAYSVTSFDVYHLSKEAPAYMQAFSNKLQRNHREMTMSELATEIRAARAMTNPTVRRIRLALARTNWHERFALPAAALVFALLALPLGLVNRRGGKASGFALSLGVVLVYWVGYSILRDLSEKGHLPPPLALWLPNLVFAVLALLLTIRRGQGRPRTVRGLDRLRGLGRNLRARRLAGARRLADVRAEQVPSPAVRAANPFPQLIDRYVARNFLMVFALVMSAVYIVYLLVEFRALLQDVIDNHVATSVLLQYLFFRLPQMTANMLPISCLVATLVGIGLMARAREHTAVTASGVSLYRLLAPLLLITAGFSIAGYYLQDRILPATNQQAEAYKDRITGHLPRSRDPRHRWVMARDGHLYHYEHADPERGRILGLSVFTLDPETFALRERSFSSTARWDGNEWLVDSGWQRSFTDDSARVDLVDDVVIDIPLQPSFFESEETGLLWGVRREPDEMSYHDQRSYIARLARSGYDTTRLQVALAHKMAFPTIPLFMVLLGFPFSFRVGPRGSLFGVGLAIGLSFAYWTVLAVFNALGAEQFLSPLLAAWTPNVLFGGLGLYLSLHLRT